MVSDCFACFCTVVIRRIETFWSLCIIIYGTTVVYRNVVLRRIPALCRVLDAAYVLKCPTWLPRLLQTKMYVVCVVRVARGEGVEGGWGLFKAEFTIWAGWSGDAASEAGRRADSHCLYLFVTAVETNLKRGMELRALSVKHVATFWRELGHIQCFNPFRSLTY
jgi:hypothetical protein